MFAIFLIFNLTGCKESDAGFTYTTPTAGEERTEITGSVLFELRYTPAGTFVMGEDVQSPTPVITLARGFWMAETEVAYELWYEVYTWAV